MGAALDKFGHDHELGGRTSYERILIVSVRWTLQR